MAHLDDPDVKKLLDAANHAVLTTLGPDGAPHSTVIWQDPVDGGLGINSAKGRQWPTDLLRDPRASVVVYDQANPYEYVELRGRAEVIDGADEQIDKLAKKYIGAESYPFRQPGEERIGFRLVPDRVRHQKQG